VKAKTMKRRENLHSRDFLSALGVPEMTPRTSPFDPGDDPHTLAGHLEQSAHLMEILKMSMACWIVADERVTREKIVAAKRHAVPTVTGGGPFEVAVAQGQLEPYLDLCADFGFTRIECGEGFTDVDEEPASIVRRASVRGLEVQFELGKKHAGAFTSGMVEQLIDQGRRWLDAGSVQLIIEARESAQSVGLFGENGGFRADLAERFVEAFGFERVVFEAPTKPSQFALLDQFGPMVHLCNVRLEELLRVEIYRRGLHSDAFSRDNLRPPRPPSTTSASSPDSSGDD
jgi:phosphosulfolactate synthase